jgi:thiamine phosphate synthase YjbQ (UPF0047 family)
MQVRLNAFHKDSSASYSKTVEVNSQEELAKEMTAFDSEVPFSRWYYEHEAADDDNMTAHLLDKWLTEIEEKTE